MDIFHFKLPTYLKQYDRHKEQISQQYPFLGTYIYSAVANIT